MTRLSVESLDYAPNTLALMDTLVELAWPFLLDSGQKMEDYPAHHIDIIGALPSLRLESTLGRTTLIDNDGKTQSLPESIFSAIKQRLPQLTIPQAVAAAPGWYGCIAYDMSKQLERLPEKTTNDLALPDATFGFYEWIIVTDHANKSTQLVYTDNADLTPVRRALSIPTQRHATFSIVNKFLSDQTPESYQAQFAKIQHYILSGDVYQINFAQRFSAPFQGCTWQAYKILRKDNPAPMGGYFSFNQYDLLSLSPERFIRSKGRTLTTSPIKGTRPRSQDKQQDIDNANTLRHSAKDQAENLMIVDLLRNDFGKVCQPGSVSVPELFGIESYPTVHHLVSTITGTLAEGYASIDAVERGFPGGSITGAPKIRAMEIIEEIERHRRSYYCGSICYFNVLGDCDSNINIRTFIAKSGAIHCWGGGGIVADSVCEQEYQETFDKVGPYLSILENAKP